MNSREM
jgi:hypothetical protein